MTEITVKIRREAKITTKEIQDILNEYDYIFEYEVTELKIKSELENILREMNKLPLSIATDGSIISVIHNLERLIKII